jgi:hypothetical protein
MPQSLAMIVVIFVGIFEDRVKNIAKNIVQRVGIIAEDRRCIERVVERVEKVIRHG